MDHIVEKIPPWKKWNLYTRPTFFKDNTSIQIENNGWDENHNTTVDALKEKINVYDKTEIWDLAKRITNQYELVYTYSTRLNLPPSSCMYNPLSRSFYKMVEILYLLNFFQNHKDSKLRSLHICEGPGGFIEAFLYGAQDNRRNVGKCYGMTLKSTNVFIPGWRRTQNFLKRHKNVTLCYGADETGDVYVPENQSHTVEFIKNDGGKVQFATADGGFDFSEDFYGQEKNMLRLLVCSVLIMFQCLAENGDCVIKIFDINGQATRDFIALCASCFRKWTLYKPATSRPSNSEWYFVGQEFISLHSNQVVIPELLKLRDVLKETNNISKILTVNPLNDYLLDLQEKHTQHQIETLQHVLSFCESTYDETSLQALWEKYRKYSVQWCNTFRMPTNYKL